MFNYLPMRFKVVFLMFIVSAKQGKKLLRKCFKSCHLSYSLSGFSQSTMCRLCTCLTVYRTSLSVQCADCVPVLPSLSVQCADCVPVLQFIGFLSVYNVQIVYLSYLLSVYNVQIVYLSYSLSDFSQCTMCRLCTCLTVYRTSLSVIFADCVPVFQRLYSGAHFLSRIVIPYELRVFLGC